MESIVATALSITVMDVLLGIVDAASAAIWAQARPDLQRLLEGVITADDSRRRSAAWGSSPC